MIYNLFSTPIYKINIGDVLGNTNDIEKIVRENLNVASIELSSLEKNGGTSTYATNNQLHASNCLQELCNLVLLHSKMYWKILDIDERLSPRIF